MSNCSAKSWWLSWLRLPSITVKCLLPLLKASSRLILSQKELLNSTNYGSQCCRFHSAEPYNPPVSLAWTQNRRAVKTSVLCQTTCWSVPASPSQGKELTPLQDHFEWAIEKCIHIQVARGECESASIKRIEQQLKLSIFLYQLGLNPCLKLLRYKTWVCEYWL